VMIRLEDSIKVDAPAESVFQWLAQRMRDRESYRAWHPDHVDLRWIKGEPLQEGAVVYAEERLHGRLHKLKFRITRVVPNRLIAYRSLFPLSLLAPENRVITEPNGEHRCTFAASASLRVPRWLFERHHPGQIEGALQHMREEGQNLKRAVESLGAARG